METIIATHGHVGQIRKYHEEMQALRKKGDNVSFREYLSRISNGQSLPEQVLAELKIDPRVMTEANMLALDDDSKWLYPEIIREAILKGVIEDPIWPDLVIRDEPVSGLSIKAPYVDRSSITISKVAEGGSVPKSLITYGDKDVKLDTREVGIDITRQVLKYSSIDILAVHLGLIGSNLAALITEDALDVLQNGEQEDGSEAAAVIGVNATADGLTYSDLLTAFIRMSRMNATPDSAATTEALSKTILEMAEFKTPYQGAPTMTARLKRPLPTNLNLFPTGNVATGKVVLTAQAKAMMKVTAEALILESQKIIARGIVETMVGSTYGFYIVERTGRVVIDSTVTYVANPFPSWFNPIR